MVMMMASTKNRALSKRALARRSKMTMTMTIVIFDRPPDDNHITNAIISRYVTRSIFLSLPADVDVVHIWGLLLVRSNGNRGGNGWLGDLLNLDAPLILWFFKVGQSELRLPI